MGLLCSFKFLLGLNRAWINCFSATVPENELPGYDVISVSATDLDDPNTSKYGEIRYYISSKSPFVVFISSLLNI